MNQLQSQSANDPLRRKVKGELNTFFQALKDNDQIDGYQVICSLASSPTAKAGNGVNTPASIARRYLYAMIRVTYLASVRFFILTLQGGTTVVTVSSQPPGQSLAA